MSDNVLKASIRQTLAYIDAYDVDLLRAIEAAFTEALHTCNDEDEDEDEVEDEDEDEDETATEEQTAPPPEPQPTPQPIPTAKPTRASTTPTPAALELFELPVWHYRLPLIATLSTAALLLIFAR